MDWVIGLAILIIVLVLLGIWGYIEERRDETNRLIRLAIERNVEGHSDLMREVHYINQRLARFDRF